MTVMLPDPDIRVYDDEFRVRSWDEFVGQKLLKLRLDLHIQAYRSWDGRGEAPCMPHILLIGEPGFGKTTLAGIIASRSGQPLHALTMPIRPPAMTKFFKYWTGGVLLLDELHAASTSLQEDLLPVLLERRYQTRRGTSYDLPWLTVIGATTEPRKLIGPLVDRFHVRPYFDPYTDEEMARIVQGMARTANVELTDADACILGRATGGVPRRAQGFVVVARDLQRTHRKPTAELVLQICRVDHDGLEEEHRAYLRCLDQLGGQRGVEKIAAQMGQHPQIVQRLERLLFRHGLIEMTNGGRELTRAGYMRLTNG